MYKELASQILEQAQASNRRYLVGIAGPPASGKSTLAEELGQEINHQRQDISAVIPMDGFHLDNAKLDELGLRHRKGAPETFDAKGFVQLIRQLKAANIPVGIPLFDRAQDAVIPDAQTVSASRQILLVEGNYLLLDSEPWCQLQDLFDFTVLLNPGIEVLEERLVQRWLKHGYDETGARERALSNDIPNARYVLEHSVGADLVLA